MTDESSTRISKFLSYILRHHPEAIGLELDSHGWAHIPSLIQKARKHDRTISREQIMEVIQESGRQRFLLSPDGQYIRAAYGHSIVVDLSLEPKQPPEVLYHGTARKNIDSILEEGLHSAGRNFVHLSANKEDAVPIGRRHGQPVVLGIHASAMHQAGYPFYQSESEPGIWMVNKVPPEYISKNAALPE